MVTIMCKTWLLTQTLKRGKLFSKMKQGLDFLKILLIIKKIRKTDEGYRWNVVLMFHEWEYESTKPEITKLKSKFCWDSHENVQDRFRENQMNCTMRCVLFS